MTEKTKKDILSTLAEVEKLNIYGDIKAKEIDFKDIKGKTNSGKKDLQDWNNRDFAIYLLDSFKNKYSRDHKCLLTGTTLYMPRVQSEISKAVGFCDNIVFKDYIDFYYDKWASKFLQKSNEFFVNTLKEESVLRDFAKNYSYRENIINDKQSLVQELESSYKISLENFVLDYGIIVSINWLIKNNHDSKDAMRSVCNVILKNIDLIDSILLKTKKLSPYPESLKFKKYKEYLDIVSKKIERKIDHDVMFTSKKSQTKWNFLGE